MYIYPNNIDYGYYLKSFDCADWLINSDIKINHFTLDSKVLTKHPELHKLLLHLGGIIFNENKLKGINRKHNRFLFKVCRYIRNNSTYNIIKLTIDLIENHNIDPCKAFVISHFYKTNISYYNSSMDIIDLFIIPYLYSKEEFLTNRIKINSLFLNSLFIKKDRIFFPTNKKNELISLIENKEYNKIIEYINKLNNEKRI